ncbi:hypothetical protein Psesu_0356 [Pseudoxanthomonas suwonensis 11-1]|uniref:DUF2249 domain-containing protein n=1 Tax=Pseudoxanthomonas suwonensis (strain 11-1) TaxID=743721 RepID=E6WPH3_PSEUU|nr:DUF2249 domain-containing protein [Pseudoxanthomonas suwonensis]ADV26217.1 hypothetical protein Psesu_0356 [Pseudoxanthomonas suwonensis 11-1]
MQRRLDLRGLPPPQPMECILAALATLPPGGRLFALTPMRPLPLLSMLEADGFRWRLRDLQGGGTALRIRHAQPAQA